MTRLRKYRIGWVGMCGLLVSGCVSAGPSPLSYGLRHVKGGDRAVVFETAQKAVAELGYAIDRADSTAGIITTVPISEPYRSGFPRSGVRLSSQGRLRRVVQIRIDGRGDAVDVYCKVALEQQVTAAHRMFAYDRMGTDVPGATPIDREAATTTEQNTVWQTVRRDKAAERRILEAILERAGQSSG